MILSRTLTKKSKLGFGKYKNETVGHLLSMRCFKALISPYYKLSSINYTEDVLKELGIVGDWIIEKPGIDKIKYVDFLKYKGLVRIRTSESPDKLKKEAKYTKGYNQSKNHGRR